MFRLGLLSAAHVHAPSYARVCALLPGAEFAGVWDDDPARADAIASRHGGKIYHTAEALIEASDAVVICSENTRHADLGVLAAGHGKHILCEKPLVTSEADGQRLLSAVDAAGVVLMTAFPCPFSPAFQRLQRRVEAGEIGRILAVCATNHGRCPFGWFVERDKSGGGAMIDHTVHVADLLRRLLGESPNSVYAQTGSLMYGREWEDTAMLTLAYPGGAFATLDSSWSRLKEYRAWGDVTMNVVGEKGVIELNMFAPALDVYTTGHAQHGYGSDLDRLMIEEFVRAIQEGTPPSVTGEDGLRAARVAIAAYESVGRREPVSPPN